MIFQKNEKCPVCDKFFTDNDDIVICPDCGTPHHRECYNSLGHCANSDKHSEGFEYEYISEQKDAESSPDDTVQGSVYYQPNGEDSRSDNENDTSPMPDFMSQFKTDTAYDNSEETIDGKKIELILKDLFQNLREIKIFLGIGAHLYSARIICFSEK